MLMNLLKGVQNAQSSCLWSGCNSKKKKSKLGNQISRFIDIITIHSHFAQVEYCGVYLKIASSNGSCMKNTPASYI